MPRLPALRLFPLLCGLALATLNGAAAEKAPKAASRSDDWLVLPGSYTGRRVVRAENAPPRVFRVIIEAGPATQGQPRLISSCGEKPLDELALQFTSASLQGSKELREMASKKVAVFRIQMHAPSAANSSYQGSKTREVANENALFYTPKPPYPRQARKEDDKGTGLVRVEWLPGQKKPAYVFMENSIGSALLDTSTLQWAVLHWERSQTEAALVKRIPITYRLTPGRRARPNF